VPQRFYQRLINVSSSAKSSVPAMIVPELVRQSARSTIF
jgi:hypothetical protein